MNQVTAAIDEPARRTPLWGEYDLVVLGGGPAGLHAACAASRRGLRCLLIERYGFLGGMGTAAGVTNFCGLHANVHGQIRQVVHGLTDELLERMRGLGGLNEPHLLFGGKIAAQAYDNATLKLAADQMLLASGAEILFHALAVGVTKRDRQQLDTVLIETRSGRFAVRARLFIDASGDGELFAHAGLPFEKGSDGEAMMYPSTMFRVNNVDAARAGQAWLHFDEWMDQARAQGHQFARRMPIIRPQKNPTEWRANVTQLANADGTPVDGTDARQLSAAEFEGRRQIAEFVRFLRTFAPGFEQAYLLEIAPQVGIRETRRLVGRYQLTERDVLGCASFEDSIGVNGWMIEEHVAGSVSFVFQDIPASRGFNHLPWRMMLPQGCDNLLVAGRCASMTHLGQSAARVSGACFVMGQAAGTAAALALAASILPAQVPVPALQQALVQDGAYLGMDQT